MEPIVACTVLGLYRSTVSGEHTTSRTPNQSAVRTIVPRLPGSRTPSRASTTRPGEKSGSPHCGISHTASTPSGVDCALMRPICAWVTHSTGQGHTARAMGKNSSVANTSRREIWPPSAISLTDFMPSMVNNCDICRVFLDFKELIFFILPLVSIASGLLGSESFD